MTNWAGTGTGTTGGSPQGDRGIVYDDRRTSTPITEYGKLKGTANSGDGSRSICARKVCLFDAMMLDNFKSRGVDHSCGRRQFQHMPDIETYPPHYNWTDGITPTSV